MPHTTASTKEFNRSEWLSSLLFAHASGVNANSASGQISQHLPGHRLDCPVCRSRLQSDPDLPQIGITASSERQHQGTQHLLSDVERLNIGIGHDAS